MADVLSIPTEPEVAQAPASDWVPVIALDDLVARGRKVLSAIAGEERTHIALLGKLMEKLP